MDLVEEHWEDVTGEMPLKISYPELEGRQRRIVIGYSPKNTRWSYHDGGSWPVLLWLLTAACIKTGCVAFALAEQDHALMEAEKFKDRAEVMSHKLNDSQKRLEELNSDANRSQEFLLRLEADLSKQGKEIEIFKKVVNKFYEIGHQTSVGIEDEDNGWDDKCSYILDDLAET
ncbi:hypothetical protein Nepgr_018337 [Nepenthes gracilis]|uniref:Uncharacterized protein n=1 Tax=Nepenthes gracilis TaxID=150966 RepID=A0AAD3STH4_NEPGR|nr:hypothetical protein Nepgr_018337 [Nepenthes gracilis]